MIPSVNGLRGAAAARWPRRRHGTALAIMQLHDGCWCSWACGGALRMVAFVPVRMCRDVACEAWFADCVRRSVALGLQRFAASCIVSV